jgi:predicted 3-demethylubiquinone-9 3-methyltransferase (glyoxalase superfamily)
MQKIRPFLWFDKEAEEAARLYVSIFKNSKINRIVHYGDAGPGPKGTVMTVDFEVAGETFAALNGGPIFKFNESVSFVINCETQAEVDDLWEGCPPAAAVPVPAAGSRTVSGSPGRWCRPRCRGFSPTPTR